MSLPISMKELLEAGVHFGHQTRKWNPKMKKYIFGARNKVHIIDLQQTVTMFKDAFEFVRERASDGEQILFVGTKRQAVETIQAEAERCNGFYVTNRWLGGMLTNYRTIRESVEKYNELEKQHEEGNYRVRTKKESMMKDKLRQKLARNLSGIRKMGRLPGMIFVIDPHRENIAVREAKNLGIPVIAICDTNCDPAGVDYIIPGNDDAIRSVKLFASRIADACLEGQALYKEKAPEDRDPRQGRGGGRRGPAVKHVKKTGPSPKGQSAGSETPAPAQSDAAPKAEAKPAEGEAKGE